MPVVVGDTVPALSVTWHAAAAPYASANLDGETLLLHLTFTHGRKNEALDPVFSSGYILRGPLGLVSKV